MDAATFIDGLPDSFKETVTIGAVSATAGLASVSAEVAAALYGNAARYRGSRWIDVADFGEPTPNTRITCGSVPRIIIGVHVYPGSLRRLDLGQDIA
jgi:hypothetical protein